MTALAPPSWSAGGRLPQPRLPWHTDQPGFWAQKSHESQVGIFTTVPRAHQPPWQPGPPAPAASHRGPRLPRTSTARSLRVPEAGALPNQRGAKVTAPSLPRERVPDDYQAAGPFVGRGDPPPVFADAEAGDHVRVALGKRARLCSEGPTGRTEPLSTLVGVSPQPVVLTRSVPHSA